MPWGIGNLGSGGGSGIIPVDVLPAAPDMRPGSIYRLKSNETLWTREEEPVPSSLVVRDFQTSDIRSAFTGDWLGVRATAPSGSGGDVYFDTTTNDRHFYNRGGGSWNEFSDPNNALATGYRFIGPHATGDESNSHAVTTFAEAHDWLDQNYVSGITYVFYNTTPNPNVVQVVTAYTPAGTTPIAVPVNTNFRLGPAPNTFADDTARDASVVVAPYDANSLLVIQSGSAFQNRVSSAWIDVTPIIRGAAGTMGLPGDDAPIPEFEYSTDGTTYTTTPSTSDPTTHIRVSTDGGTTFTPFELERGQRGTPGRNGTNAPTVIIQGSVTGTSLWHAPPVAGDYFLRFSVDGGNLYDGVKRFRGEDAPALIIEGSVDGTGNWHAPPVGTDFFLRFSVDNGVTYSAVARFRGIDGADGTQVIIQGSVDGQGSWHTPVEVTDFYLRFSVDNGVTFTGAVQFRGTDGADGTQVIIQGSVTGTGNWHAPPVGTDFFLRFSVDNGATYTGAMQFRGTDGTDGINGTNAPDVIVEGSVDGASNWHTPPVGTDFYLRFSVDGGNTYSSAVQFRGIDGTDGTNAPLVIIQGSVNGTSNWHTPATPADFFLRFSVDGGATFADAMQFRGTDGSDGTQVIIQGSVTGTGNWHAPPVGTDFFLRFSVDNGATFTDAMRFRGADGTDGTNAPDTVIQGSVNGTSNWHAPVEAADFYVRFSVDGGNTYSAAVRFRGQDGADGSGSVEYQYSPTETDSDFHDPPYVAATDRYLRFRSAGQANWSIAVAIEGGGGELEYQFSPTTTVADFHDAPYVAATDKYIRTRTIGSANWSNPISMGRDADRLTSDIERTTSSTITYKYATGIGNVELLEDLTPLEVTIGDNSIVSFTEATQVFEALTADTLHAPGHAWNPISVRNDHTASQTFTIQFVLRVNSGAPIVLGVSSNITLGSGFQTNPGNFTRQANQTIDLDAGDTFSFWFRSVGAVARTVGMALQPGQGTYRPTIEGQGDRETIADIVRGTLNLVELDASGNEVERQDLLSLSGPLGVLEQYINDRTIIEFRWVYRKFASNADVVNPEGGSYNGTNFSRPPGWGTSYANAPGTGDYVAESLVAIKENHEIIYARPLVRDETVGGGGELEYQYSPTATAADFHDAPFVALTDKYIRTRTVGSTDWSRAISVGRDATSITSDLTDVHTGMVDIQYPVGSGNRILIEDFRPSDVTISDNSLVEYDDATDVFTSLVAEDMHIPAIRWNPESVQNVSDDTQTYALQYVFQLNSDTPIVVAEIPVIITQSGFQGNPVAMTSTAQDVTLAINDTFRFFFRTVGADVGAINMYISASPRTFSPSITSTTSSEVTMDIVRGAVSMAEHDSTGSETNRQELLSLSGPLGTLKEYVDDRSIVEIYVIFQKVATLGDVNQATGGSFSAGALTPPTGWSDDPENIPGTGDVTVYGLVGVREDNLLLHSQAFPIIGGGGVDTDETLKIIYEILWDIFPANVLPSGNGGYAFYDAVVSMEGHADIELCEVEYYEGDTQTELTATATQQAFSSGALGKLELDEISGRIAGIRSDNSNYAGAIEVRVETFILQRRGAPTTADLTRTSTNSTAVLATVAAGVNVAEWKLRNARGKPIVRTESEIIFEVINVTAGSFISVLEATLQDDALAGLSKISVNDENNFPRVQFDTDTSTDGGIDVNASGNSYDNNSAPSMVGSHILTFASHNPADNRRYEFSVDNILIQPTFQPNNSFGGPTTVKWSNGAVGTILFVEGFSPHNIGDYFPNYIGYSYGSGIQNHLLYPNNFNPSAAVQRVKVWTSGQENAVNVFVFFDGTWYRTIVADDGTADESPADSTKYEDVWSLFIRSKEVSVPFIAMTATLPQLGWGDSGNTTVWDFDSHDPTIALTYTISNDGRTITCDRDEMTLDFGSMIANAANALHRFNNQAGDLQISPGDITIGATVTRADATVETRVLLYSGEDAEAIVQYGFAEIQMSGNPAAITLFEGDSLTYDIADSVNAVTSATPIYGNMFVMTGSAEIVKNLGYEFQVSRHGTLFVIDRNTGDAEEIYRKDIGAQGILKDEIERDKLFKFKIGDSYKRNDIVSHNGKLFDVKRDVGSAAVFPLLEPTNYEPRHSFGVDNDHLSVTNGTVGFNDLGSEAGVNNRYWTSTFSKTSRSFNIVGTYHGLALDNFRVNRVTGDLTLYAANSAGNVDAINCRIRTRAVSTDAWGAWMTIATPSETLPLAVPAYGTATITFTDNNLSLDLEATEGWQIEWNVSIESTTASMHQQIGDTSLDARFTGRFNDLVRVYFNLDNDLVMRDMTTMQESIIVRADRSLNVVGTEIQTHATGAARLTLYENYKSHTNLLVTIRSHDDQIVEIPVEELDDTLTQDGLNFTFNDTNRHLEIQTHGYALRSIAYI